MYFIMQRRKEYLSDLCLEEGKYILEGDFENPVHNGFVIQREFQSPIPIEVSMGKKKN